MKANLNVLIFCALLAMPVAAVADQATPSVNQPVHGMTMQNVEQIFGAPVKKVPAVGEPPIARWIYTDYVVYFEHNIVLHTVSKDKPFHDAPPAPVTKIVSGHGD
ncbi:MAG TPA: phosphodiesterase [Gammaproteobacteria bacterium]|nr:phosphodiesterase [Gammaproteobacteria bacterium]